LYPPIPKRVEWLKPTGLKLSATWRDDCQGKKDYDAPVLSISTRYWPSSYQKNGKISASSALVLNHGDDDYMDLLKREFEGDTEEEVKKQVEEWAQNTFELIISLIRREPAETFI
jgi:hypothetical protein